MVEEVTKEEKKEDKKTEQKKKSTFCITKKGLIVLTGGVILTTTGIGFKISHYANYETPLDIASSISSLVLHDTTTTIYDHCEETLVAEVDFLDGATSVYTKLNSIDLEKYDKGLPRINIDVIYENEIDKLIDKYKKLKKGDIKTPSNDSIEFYNVVNELLSYKDALTEQRYIDGIESINKFANIVINANIYDTLSTSMNYESVSTNLIDIDAKELEIHYITDTNIDFVLRTSYFCDLQYLAKDLRELNELKLQYENGNMTDIKKLIKKENEVIKFIKTCIYSDYSIKDEKISQYEGHLDVKKKVNIK